MADKKTGVPMGAIDRYTKSFRRDGWTNATLNNNGIELRYKVRGRVGLADFGSAVMKIARSCFKDGEYRAWILDYAIRSTVVETYTNIAFNGDDTEAEYRFLTDTDIYENVISNIDEDQFDALITAVDEQICALDAQYNSARERELGEAVTMLRMVDQKYHQLITICEELAGDDIRDLAKRLQESARDVTDEVAAVRAAVGAEEKPAAVKAVPVK